MPFFGHHSSSASNLVASLFILIVFSIFLHNNIRPCLAAVGPFVQRNGDQLTLAGSPFLFNGFNSYWMMQMAVDLNQRAKVSKVFSDAAAAGLSVCRTWAFNDGDYQPLQQSPGVYDERVFQALDYVIAEAGNYKIYLILSLVNNYKDYGGRPQYVNWAKAAGAAVTAEDDFYTNSIAKGFYKNHVQKILTRVNTITGAAYKDDSTIMAWELINEPRCQSDLSGKTVNAWVEEMAGYVKSIDSEHLVEAGMEGFYGDSTADRKQYNPGYQVGTDFITTNLIPQIDFTTIHAYPDAWLAGQNEDAQMGFMRRWMLSHWTDSKDTVKKPLVLAEFGKSSKDPAYTTTARNTYMNAVYNIIYSCARNGSFSGGIFWQILPEGAESSYDDGYGIVMSQNPSTAAIISQQSSLMTSLQGTKSKR